MTSLVLLGDNYSDDQAGYLEAVKDGAVHIVDIDEQSYTALYNVQNSIAATVKCTGVEVSIGVVKDGYYLTIGVIDDHDRCKGRFGYESLHEAHDQAMVWHLEDLRAAVDDSLQTLSDRLPAGDEQAQIDHCIDSIGRQRKSG